MVIMHDRGLENRWIARRHIDRSQTRHWIPSGCRVVALVTAGSEGVHRLTHNDYLISFCACVIALRDVVDEVIRIPIQQRIQKPQSR